MPSLGHVAVGMAAARFYRRSPPARWTLLSAMVAWSALSLLPDADVVGFRFGIAYGDPWGHRGAAHSPAFSLLVGAAIALVSPLLRLPPWRTGALATLVMGSHGLLDAFTDGGLGCVLLWPFSDERFFSPWRPLPVAPIGRAFLSAAGLHVVWVEAAWFAPLLVYALAPRSLLARLCRRRSPGNAAQPGDGSDSGLASRDQPVPSSRREMRIGGKPR